MVEDAEGRVMRFKAGLMASLMTVAMPLSAQSKAPFTINDMPAEHSVSELKLVPFFEAERQSLIVKGRTEEQDRVFSFYEIQEGNLVSATPTLTVSMPDDALFYDFASIFDTGQESLLFLNDAGVQRFDPTTDTFEPFMALRSIYRQSSSPLFEQMDFARDLNGDGLADIIVPDFDGYWLRLNDGNGGFHSQVLLDMQVEMRLSQNRPLYSEFPLHSSDVNFDGKKDIIFQKDQSFVVFHQVADGGFETSPTVYDVDIDVTGNSFAALVRSNERYQDQSDLAETRIVEIEDINGDGIIDIVTETDRAKGLFDRSTTYQFHYGVNSDGKLMFQSEPSANVTLKGITARNRYLDFTDDGRKDFVGGSVNIGIGKIIGILLSGSVGIHVNFYEQGEDGRFGAKPTFRKKVNVDFDMSSGQSSVPVAEMTDIDGDKAKDMIVSKGNEELRLYYATPGGKKMFRRKEVKLKIDLPKNGELVSTEDVNGDGKGDLLIHFDRLGADGAENKNRFIVLIAN